MTQSEVPRINGSWKALFITSNSLIRRELSPFLLRIIPQLSSAEVGYPQPAQVVGVLRAESPDLCFLDFGKDSEGAFALLPELLKVNPSLVIVALLSSSDPNLVLRCLRQGATDFLLIPFTADHVETTLQKIAKVLPADKLRKPATIYCTMPAKGGCGATTVACNLAYQLKRTGYNRVLLADLDPLAGTISFVLKIKSQYSFMDVLHRSSDIDADLWRTMVTKQNGVDVLLSPETIMQGADDLTDASSIVEYARYNYDAVVLDSSGPYGPWNLTQARLCDEILLVATNELAALQAVHRAFVYLENNDVARWKVRVIVNRYLREAGLSEEMIATALNTDVYQLLPDDTESVKKALMEGKAVQSSSSLGKRMALLADKLAGREKSSRKSSSFAGLLSLFNRTSS